MSNFYFIFVSTKTFDECNVYLFIQVPNSPLSSTLAPGVTSTTPLKGPGRYLLANLAKNPAVPRTAVVDRLKVLEESVRTGNPLLYASTQFPMVPSSISSGTAAAISDNEAEAAAYIANSPLMRPSPHRFDLIRPGGVVRTQQQRLLPPPTPPRPAAKTVLTTNAGNSPRPTESAENTPMFHKTPARFVASRTMLPLATAAAANAGVQLAVAARSQASHLTPAAAGEMRSGGGGCNERRAGGGASRPVVATPVGRQKRPKGPLGGLGVFRPSDADLGYPPSRNSTASAAVVQQEVEKRPPVASSSKRYRYLTGAENSFVLRI